MITTSTEHQPYSLTLRSVIAIYHRDNPTNRMDSQNHAVAIAHPVYGGTYGPGKIVTQQFLSQIQRVLSSSAGLFVLPENVLAYNATGPATAWWVPERVRTCRFCFHRESAHLDDGELVRHLQPPHIFLMQGHTFKAFALPDNSRPTGDTQLLVSPYWNLYKGGSLCVGSTDFREPTPENISWNTEAFFSSVFTHPNCESSAHPKSDYALWREIKDQEANPQPIPREYFLEAHLSVSQLLGGR